MIKITYIVKNTRQGVSMLALCMLLMLSLSPIVSAAPNKSNPKATTTPTTTVDSCSKGFLGLEPWYYFLPDADFYGSAGDGHDKCDLRCFNVLDQGSSTNECGRSKSDIPLVLLAVIDDLLRITGLVALGFVIYGAFQFVASQGSPDASTKARNTVINALLGLAIASIAVGVVSFLGNRFGAGT